MSSDDRQQRAQPAFRQAGTGLAYSWLCPGCGHARATLGRRKKHVMGTAMMVCAKCAAGKR